jgi:hypothetical protein
MPAKAPGETPIAMAQSHQTISILNEIAILIAKL